MSTLDWHISAMSPWARWRLSRRCHAGASVSIQKSQCAHAKRNRAESQLILFHRVQLELAYVVGAHQFRRLAEVFGKLLDGVNVTTNGVGGVVTGLEFPPAFVDQDGGTS
jgi:hypothetical protein